VVNVGVTHHTAKFAVEGIRRGWKLARCSRKPRGERILICAHAGGSNSSWSRTLEATRARNWRRTRDGHHGLTFSAGNQQMEQDRAPAVFFYQSYVKGAAADQL
jgi:hypothetical protein